MSWGRRKRNEGNLVQETLGLKKDIDPLQKHKNSIKMTEFDRELFHDTVDQYEVMQENMQSGLDEYAPFGNLSEDIYQSLFSYKARMHDEEDMDAFSRLNHQMMEGLMESEQYDQLRKNTKFDVMNSAIGTEVMQNQAMEKIQYFKQQYIEQQKTGQKQDGGDAGELIEQLNKARDAQNRVDELNEKGGPGGKGLTQREAEELARLQQQIQDLEDEIDLNKSGQEEMKQGMEQAMESASKKAFEEVREVRDTMESWGLDGTSSTMRISIDRRKKAIERIRRSPRLNNLTDLVGRMKAIALQKKTQRTPDGHSVRTIETGNDLSRVTPTSLMKLASPSTRNQFMKEFSEKQLQLYKKDGIKKVGRGPIIVDHDKSGSMRGNKDDWSTALTLAMLEVAQKEKRNFGYIPYQHQIVASHVKNIPAGELDPDDIMDIAELDSSGGTTFMPVLDESIRCLESDRYKKGDIVFITDGDCGITDEWLKEFKKKKEQLQFNVLTVLINLDGGASRATVEKFSDQIITLSSIADLDPVNAKQIFNLVEDDSKFDAQPDPNAQP